MDKIHEKNIGFLNNLFESEHFDWIQTDFKIDINYFTSGGGTHLYLIENAHKKYLARINFYPGKNEWGVKKQEYTVLKMIEDLEIAPKVYYFNNNNSLKQDLTIVDYIEGKQVDKLTDSIVVDLAHDLYTLHTSFHFDTSGDTFPPFDELPYICEIYNEFANGEDKHIEEYMSWQGIDKVVDPFNRINKKLGNWFNNLKIFDTCTKFSLCHADLKKENILVTKTGVMLVDWECAGSDIPETDIGGLFSGCEFTQEQQNLFLKTYYGTIPDEIILQRIDAVKTVLDFFHILEDYIILKRLEWDSNAMLVKLLDYERKLTKLI